MIRVAMSILILSSNYSLNTGLRSDFLLKVYRVLISVTLFFILREQRGTNPLYLAKCIDDRISYSCILFKKNISAQSIFGLM